MRVISPAPHDAWEAIHTADPNALVSQSAAWMNCICYTTGATDASRLYNLGDGRMAVLPLAQTRVAPMFLSSLRSPPSGWGIGGLIANCNLQVEDLCHILDDLARLPHLSISIRPNPLTDQLWASAMHAHVIALPRRAHVLDLVEGFDALWLKRYKHATRTAVRKAEKSGVTIECNSDEKSVIDFHKLYLRSLDRWGAQQHEPRALTHWRGLRRDPIQKLQNISIMSGINCRIYTARVNGEPVAASLLLIGQNAHMTRDVMIKELAGPVRANDLLYNRAIKDACEAGCHYFHMGETGSSISLARFKSGFGAEAYEYAEYRLERLPLTQVDALLRKIVKRIIGFKDTTNDARANEGQH